MFYNMFFLPLGKSLNPEIMTKLKYEQKLDEYEITSLDHPDLADSFKNAAKEFEKKRSNNELSDEEIAAEDKKLLQLFEDVHHQKSEDNEETRKLKDKNLTLEGTAAVGKTKDISELEALKEKYKESADVVKLIENKIAAIKAYTSAREEIDNTTDVEALNALKGKHTQYPDLVKAIEKKIIDLKAKKKDQSKAEATQEVENAKDIKSLNALKVKHSQYPDLGKVIEKKILTLEESKKASSKKTLKEKLLSQKEWDYSELKAVGINPTGEDMTVEGVFLERQFLLDIYLTRPA